MATQTATLKLRLRPTPEQAATLTATREAFTACFNHVCAYGWEHDLRNGTRLHRATYAVLRAAHPTVPSQLVCAARVKAAEALRSVHTRHRQGRKVTCPQSRGAAVRYDARSSWVRLAAQEASLTTVAGRLRLGIRLCDYYRRYAAWQTRSLDLCRDERGRWFLHVVVQTEVVDPAPAAAGAVIGVDLGLRRLAVTSDGRDATFYSSGPLVDRARRYQRLRRRLQAKGTRSARRHLRRLGRDWQRFTAGTNHLLARRIVDAAPAGSTFAVEDLKGIRDRCRHRTGAQRGAFHRWSFAQLQTFLAYKAAAAGHRVAVVDPRHTSQTCLRCGHVARGNRRTQSLFVCRVCRYTLNADLSAARTLRRRAIDPPAAPVSGGVSSREGPSVFASTGRPGGKLPASAGGT
jgi:IS605 OrfB family transposase